MRHHLCGSLLALGMSSGAAFAQGDQCPAASGPQDLTLVAAFAASPPAVDEVAFTLEVENILANTYGGDVVEYKTGWWKDYNVCGVSLFLPAGEEQIQGRWAESWSVSEDGLTWQFKIKKGVKSFAGNEMTCEDLRWSWERAFDMKAVKYSFAQKIGIEKPQDVTCVDPYTQQIKIKAPNPLFLNLLAQNYFGGPFDTVEVKKHIKDGDPWGKEWLRSNTAGFGPYAMTKHVPGQEILLERNPHFQPLPAVAKVVIKIVPDSATRYALLARGEIDYAIRLRQREYNEVSKNANLQFVYHPGNMIPFLGLVQTDPIMANKKVRQALAFATPRDEINEKVYFSKGAVINSITPKIFPNYVESWPYPYDLEMAKTLLSEAGFPDGFAFTLSYSKDIGEMEEAAALIKSSFDKIGVRTTLEGLPTAVYSERKYSRKLMAMADNSQWPWVPDTGYTAWSYLRDPTTNIDNSVYHNDPELNDITEAMLRTPFSDDRVKMDLKTQELVNDQVPWIYLVNPGWREGFKKGWGGFTWYLDNNVHYDKLYRTGQ